MGELPHTLQTQLEELRAKREAEDKSVIDSYYQSLIEDKRREIRDLERQHREALENYPLWLRGAEGDGHHSSVSSQKQSSGSSGNYPATRNSSSKLPTRRAMVEATLPSLRGRDFIRRDVEAKIIEKWPEAEPATETESRNFTARIASLLTDLVKKGQLELTMGATRFDPRVYRVKETQEEKLTLGP